MVWPRSGGSNFDGSDWDPYVPDCDDEPRCFCDEDDLEFNYGVCCCNGRYDCDNNPFNYTYDDLPSDGDEESELTSITECDEIAQPSGAITSDGAENGKEGTEREKPSSSISCDDPIPGTSSTDLLEASRPSMRNTVDCEVEVATYKERNVEEAMKHTRAASIMTRKFTEVKLEKTENNTFLQ